MIAKETEIKILLQNKSLRLMHYENTAAIIIKYNIGLNALH